MIEWIDDLRWWLLKFAVRWYVRSKVGDEWVAAYVGVNFGARNGADERHLAYIDREDWRR